jgi:hypothetical protein
MKCFHCNCPVMNMREISPSLFECTLCDMVFDLDHAKHAEKELQSIGFIHMANEYLADQWHGYFRVKHPEIKLIKYGNEQWIFIDSRGLSHVKESLLKRRKKAISELEKIDSMLKDL